MSYNNLSASRAAPPIPISSNYGGVGAAPDKGSSNGPNLSSNSIVKSGDVSVKEEGLTSWIWSKKWMVLKEQTLSFHKNEVSSVAPSRCASSYLASSPRQALHSSGCATLRPLNVQI